MISPSPLSDSSRRPTHYETESVHVGWCRAVPPGDVFPDQTMCTSLPSAALCWLVQRRLSTGRPPERVSARLPLDHLFALLERPIPISCAVQRACQGPTTAARAPGDGQFTIEGAPVPAGIEPPGMSVPAGDLITGSWMAYGRKTSSMRMGSPLRTEDLPLAPRQDGKHPLRSRRLHAPTAARKTPQLASHSVGRGVRGMRHITTRERERCESHRSPTGRSARG